MLRLLLSFLAALAPAALLAGFMRSTRRATGKWLQTLTALALASAAIAVVAHFAERYVVRLLGLSLATGPRHAASSLYAMLLFIAPFEQALTLLPIWPLYTRHQVKNSAAGVSFALASAAGFSIVRAATNVWLDASALGFLRALLGSPAHLFFAGAWGYALGSGTSARGQWFTLVWLAATMLDGLFDHIVFGRGPGLIVAVVPLLIAMAIATYSVRRELSPLEPPSSRRLAFLASLPEPPSLREMRNALRRPNRPLSIHWIGIGAFATLGMMIVSFGVTIYAAHRMGVDFGLANEGDIRASAPLTVLVLAVLSAFPLASFVTARATAAKGALEPAIGAALAVVIIVLLTSVTVPSGVVFVLAVAPAALLLACGGAWFGSR